ncbi:MAG: hypothetical protein E7172_01720 [Firmicutes bacterium]|nr:hypothetical protein [Bacillota bacterium]
MKLLEKIKNYSKQELYDFYYRITDDLKEYDKITKNKIIKKIISLYETDDFLIDYCTKKELEYLKKVIDKKIKKYNAIYQWEISALNNKLLIFDNIEIPEEFLDLVKNQLENVDWEYVEKRDKLFEILIGQIRTMGNIRFDVVIQFGTHFFEIDKELLEDILKTSPLFNFYVIFYEKDNELYVCYYRYWKNITTIDELRKKYGKAAKIEINLIDYRSIFYYGLDLSNEKVKNLYDIIKEWPTYILAADLIEMNAVLQDDRESLINMLLILSNLPENRINSFKKIVNEAIDEIPSPIFNGISLNGALKNEREEQKYQQTKYEKYQKQENAHLESKDVDLFYKLYFGLLKYVNKKLKINPNLKISLTKLVNYNELYEVIEEFWKNKDNLIDEFCLKNPYKFNDEELTIIKGFKRGIRDLFLIVKFEKEYTALINLNDVYMVKGLTCNIDEIISFEELPEAVITTILPFKNHIIYDSLLGGNDIKINLEFAKFLEKTYDETKNKIYHL